MAANIIIANPGTNDAYIITLTNGDILNLATSPKDEGGQSWMTYSANWRLRNMEEYENALLEVATDNLITLAGNYQGNTEASRQYNLYYKSGIAQKELSGILYSGGEGSINFSSQTGAAIVTDSTGNEKPVDTSIAILVEQSGTIAGGESTEDFSTSQNFSANGIRSVSGILDVTGNLSATISAVSGLSVSGLRDSSGNYVANTSGNTGNASALNAESLAISGNFTGNLNADASLSAEYKAASGTITVESNFVQTHGILVSSALTIEGVWGSESGGYISSRADGTSLFAGFSGNGEAESDLIATVSGNVIGAYGIRAGNTDTTDYSGSVAFGTSSGLFGEYGFNGTISTTANNNSFSVYGCKTGTSEVKASITENSIRSIGIAADTLTVNGQFLGTIESDASGNTFLWNRSGSVTWYESENEIIAAGIYVNELIAEKAFKGSISVSATDNTSDVLFSDSSVSYEFVTAYGIFAETITLNGLDYDGTISSGTGRLQTEITITLSNNSYNEGYGIFADEIRGDAFTGSITFTYSASNQTGLYVSSLISGSDETFDMAGSIAGSTEYGIYVTDLLNLRISGTIAVSSGYAVYADDSGTPCNDSIQIAAGASIVGSINLAGGANYIYVDSNAYVIGDLQASNGQINVTVALNRFGSVNDAGSQTNVYQTLEEAAAGNAIIEGALYGSSGSSITINLNNAAAGTYKIISGTDWGINSAKEISVSYNGSKTVFRLSLDDSASSGSATIIGSDGSSVTYELQLRLNGNTSDLYITVSDEGSSGRSEEITLAGTYSETTESVTYSWNALELDSQTIYELEYSIDGGNSIVVELDRSVNSYTISNISAGQSVTARIRLNSSNGVLYSDWFGGTDLAGELVTSGEGLTVNAVQEQTAVTGGLSSLVGSVTEGDTSFRTGNTDGANSTVIDLSWGDVSEDCLYGLNYYKVRFFVSAENISDESTIEAIWAAVDTALAAQGVDDIPAGGLELTVGGTIVNGQTVGGTTVKVYSKNVSTNHVVLSDLSDGSFYYWQVRAVDNTGMYGEWTDGIEFQVDIDDSNPPELGSPTVSTAILYSPGWDAASGTFTGTWSITVSWDNTAYDYGSGVKQYIWHYRNAESGGDYTTVSVSVPSDATAENLFSVTIDGLSGESYDAYLTAQDYTVHESEPYSMVWNRDTTGPTGEIPFENAISASVNLDGLSVSTTGTTTPVIRNAAGETVADLTQTISASLDLSSIADSGSGIYAFAFYYRVADGSWIYYGSALHENGTDYNMLLNTSASSDTEILVKAYDEAGNSTDFSWILAADTEAPVLGEVQVKYGIGDSGSAAFTITWDAAEDGGVGVAYYFVAVTDESGATVASQYIVEDGSGSYDFIFAGSGDASYNVTVSAFDWLYLVTGNSSNAVSETLTIEPDSDAPSFSDTDLQQTAVSYSMDSAGSLRQQVVLSWNAAEDEGSGVAGYYLRYRLTDGEWSGLIFTTETAYTLAGLADGEYEWEIYAADQQGNLSDTLSSSWGGDTAAPTFPSDTSTAASIIEYEDIGNSDGSCGAQILVTWNDAEDNSQTFDAYTVEGSGVKEYTIEYRYKRVNSDDYSDWITVGTTTENSWTFIAQYGNSEYEWRVYAIDCLGNTDSENAVSGTLTGDVTAPVFADDAVFSVVNSDNTITFFWSSAYEDSSIDNQSGMAKYILTIVNETTSEIYTHVLGADAVSYTISSGNWETDGMYSWSIVAVDYAGNESDAMSGDDFQIDTQAPSGSFLLLPQPTITVEWNYISQPGISSSGNYDAVDVRDPASITVTFDVSNNTFTDDSDIYYIYEISTDASFTDESQLLYSSLRASDYAYSTVYEGDTLTLSTENNGITRLAGLKSGTVIFWRVKAIDSNGNTEENWTYGGSFTMSAVIDEDDGTVRPVEDLYTNPTVPTNITVSSYIVDGQENTYMVAWDPSSDAFGIQGYEILIYNAVDSITVTVDASEITTSTERIYQLISLPESGSYYIKVRAVDGSGRYSSWSSELHVSTSSSGSYDQMDGTTSLTAITLTDTTPADKSNYTVSVQDTLGYTEENQTVARWYKFDAEAQGLTAASGLLNLTFWNVSSKLTITIYGEELKSLKKFTISKTTGGISDYLLDLSKYGSLVYVYVSSSSKNVTEASYEFSGSIDYFPSDESSNNSFAEAAANSVLYLQTTESGAVATAEGWVGYGDKADYYLISAENVGFLSGITFTNVTAKLKITVYDSNMKKVASKTISADAENLFSGELMKGNYYYVLVQSGDSGKGKQNSYYSLNLKEEYVPDLTPSANENNTITLTDGRYSTSQETREWVGYSNADDYYTFTIDTASKLYLSLTDTTAKLKITLYSEAGKKLKSITVSSGGKENALNEYLLQAGTYTVVVSSGDNGKGKYNSYYDLTITNDYFHSASGNNDFATADSSTLRINTVTSTENDDLWVGYGDAADYYCITTEGGIFNLGIFDLEAKVKVSLYEVTEKGSTKKIASKTTTSSSSNVFNKDLFLEGGTYYIVVESGDSGKGKQNTGYNLNAQINANVVALETNGSSAMDSVDSSNTYDWFSFEMEFSGKCSLNLESANSSVLKYTVYDASGSTVAWDSKTGISKNDLSAGMYYVKISLSNTKTSADYSLGIASL